MHTSTPTTTALRRDGSVRSSLGMRAAFLLAAAASVLLLSALPLAAQQGDATAPDDPRWLPWVGCWEPVDGDPVEASELLLCVTPEEAGVRIETFLGGESVSSDLIVADGEARSVSEGGCEGSTQALWSSDGRRAFLASDLTCGPDARRASRGIFAMAANGMEWVEIQALASGGRDTPMLTVQRFHPASRATLAHHEQTAPGAGLGLAIQTSREAASRALDATALVEASRSAGPEATAALVVEMGEPFELNARSLRQYRDAGVAPEVIDMMVAVTWPDRFEITAGHTAHEVQVEPARAPARAYSPYGTRAALFCASWYRGHCFGYDAWLAYNYGYFGYGARLGYSRGLGWYPWGGGWAAGPRYIVVGPGGSLVSERGRLTDDGYAPPSSRVGNARPATRAGTASSQPRATQSQSPASRPAASSAPATRSAPPPPAATQGGATTGARPAQRRTPPGGGGGEDLLLLR